MRKRPRLPRDQAQSGGDNQDDEQAYDRGRKERKEDVQGSSRSHARRSPHTFGSRKRRWPLVSLTYRLLAAREECATQRRDPEHNNDRGIHLVVAPFNQWKLVPGK